METIRKIVDMKASGMTNWQIVDRLEIMGIKTKLGGYGWSVGNVWTIIHKHTREPFYKQSLEAYRAKAWESEKAAGPYVFEAETVGVASST
jgi:hypothetical protein